jgi:outer membrane protein assembly factor BamB
MVGKLIRCASCQEMFTVFDAGPDAAPTDHAPPAEAPPRPRTDAPAVVSRSGNVSDFVPVIRDVASAQPPRPAAPPAPAPAKPRETPRADKGMKPPTDADFPWNNPPKPKPAPKEIAWSPDLRPPTGPPPLPPVDLEPLVDVDHLNEPEVDRRHERRRPQPNESDRLPVGPRKTGRKLILGAMIAFIAVALGSGGYFLIRYINEAPERLMKAGKEEYERRNWDQARKQFDTLVREHPSHRLVPEAGFLTDLCSLRQATTNVMSRTDPQPGLNEWKKVMASPTLAEFGAKGRYDYDLWDAGTKLEEDVLAKGNEVFNADTPDESEKWLNEAGEVDKALDRYRDEDKPRSPALANGLSGLRAKIDGARGRLARIKDLEQFGGGGSDEDIANYQQQATLRGLDKDPLVIAKIEDMNRRIESKAVYTREPNSIPPTAVPDDGLTSLLFAPRFDTAQPRQISWTPTTFFCQARGVLYALHEERGQVLWAARTGLDTDIMPVRVPATDQNPEMVLVASNTGNQFGITARGARDGRPLWHQSLAVPCQGPPALVGPNAYVALADNTGTVLEISIPSGEIVGRITIGRPLGPVIVARPGTGFLYVPADARAVYVFDVFRHDPDGRRLEPTLLGVMNTGHPRGSLRGVPVFSNPDPNDPGPKFLVLGQADGLETMKLKAFRLPDGPDGKPVGDPEAKEIPVPGWASFPPHCDGEKVAVVTDKGQFGLYGLALNGNPADDSLFAFPAKPVHATEPTPSRGQVVLSEESMFWVLVAGELRKFRFGINQGEGVRLIPYGDPIPAGEPLQNAQVNVRGDTFVVVTQDGMTCRATAVDSRTGEVRWRRELGLVIKGDPVRQGNAVVLMDQAGGYYRIDDTTKLAEKSGAAWLIDERWLISQPARGFTAYTGPILGPNGSVVGVLTNEAGNVLVRLLQGNSLEDRVLPVPVPPVGQPVVSGKMLILPLADGNLYRVNLSDLKAPPQAGPTWRGERLPVSSVCFIVPLNEDELFATDGARTLVRWQWPASNKSFSKNGQVKLGERPAAMPVVIPGSPPRVIVADGRGNLAMIDGDKLTLPALQTWKPNARNGLPAGPLTDGLHLEKAADGSVRIAYTADGRFVWLSPDAEKPDWVGPAPIKNLAGRPMIDGKRLILTDLAGVVRVADMQTGKETGDEFRLTGSHAFASAAVPVGKSRVLAPLADGTVVLGELKPRPKEERPKK